MTQQQRTTSEAWMALPAGERYPYAAGRSCPDCGKELSQYTPGPACNQCNPYPNLEKEVAT